MRIESRRSYPLPLDPVALWRRISAVEDYRRWWPWLRRFEGAALAPGELWRCAIRAPVPYTVRCSVRVAAAVPARFVEVEVDGDLSGRARLDLRPDGPGTLATFTSALTARRRSVRLAARLVPPLARWGHGWVLDAAARQFVAAVAPSGDDVAG